MKIAYLTSRYPAISHTFVVREVAALRRQGAQIKTFTIRRPPLAELLTDHDRQESASTDALLPVGPVALLYNHIANFFGHPLRYLAALRRAWSCRPPGLRAAVWQLFYFAEAGVLAFKMRRQRIKHVHAHFANVGASVAMLAAEMSGGTWSMTLHGLADFGNPGSLALAHKIRRANFVVCVSQFGRAQAMLHCQPKLWDKIHVVSCGIDFDSATWQPATPHEVSTSSPVQLLTVGRLAPEKGHSVLLKALAQLKKRGIDVTCTLVGEGPERDRLEREAEGCGVATVVKFAGAIGQDRIRDYYRDAHIFVLPSLAEGLPVVLMEAMAERVPVISSCLAGVPELIKDGVSGLLVPASCDGSLAAAIETLAKNPELRREMGEQGHDKVRADFDLHRNTTRLLEHFQSVVNEPTTASAAPAAPIPAEVTGP